MWTNSIAILRSVSRKEHAIFAGPTREIQRFAYIVTNLRAPLVNIMGFLSEFDTSLKPVTNYVLADGKC